MTSLILFAGQVSLKPVLEDQLSLASSLMNRFMQFNLTQ